MNHQRRSLLKAAGIAPAAASTGLVHAALRPTAPALTGTLLRSHFVPLEGDAFAFSMSGVQAKAVLKRAIALQEATDEDRSFRLLFAPSQPHSLAQGTWDVTHPKLGTHAIFVSPNDANGQEIEAIFNRQT